MGGGRKFNENPTISNFSMNKVDYYILEMVRDKVKVTINY